MINDHEPFGHLAVMCLGVHCGLAAALELSFIQASGLAGQRFDSPQPEHADYYGQARNPPFRDPHLDWSSQSGLSGADRAPVPRSAGWNSRTLRPCRAK